MRKSKVENEIMQLISLIASKQIDVANEKIESVQLMIEDELDFATADDELVLLAKYQKIVEQLKQKIAQ
ncbi:hypothetical protein [Myroides indicus]|uniref:Uncharacterized protein n=1 Tax=Myroides indicus TaxID=1323422 RepID=A0A4R7ESJ3_9FLAO|nr:hypothetical protein [Myroides indicus]TDS56571.1 hypothetical protein C8P70_1197 [Myroides indicus]